MDDLSDLFENAPCGMLVLSADGTVSRSNATLQRWLGIKPEALQGRGFSQLLTLPCRVLFETNVRPQLRLAGEIEEVSLDFLSGTGEKIPVVMSGRELRSGAGDASVQLVLTRSASRRTAERTLQKREAVATSALSTANETAELREQFIAVLGHDLRNPLASMSGGTKMLRKEALSDRASRVLDLMDGSVLRMSDLVENLMDFARGRLGSGIALETSAQPLQPVIQHVVDEFSAIFPDRQIVTEFDLPRSVAFDPSRMAQLASNLIGNAFTHGDPASPIRVSAALLDDTLHISVANGGKPIPEEARAKLFQPFFRGEVRPSQQGLGLGLHIASEIAKAHGGVLTVTSDEQQTQFELIMPAA